MIKTETGVPKYLQIREALKKNILNGSFPHESQIPSETKLAEEWGVTRETVRRAISDLVGENLLRRDHGKGTFVDLRPIKFSLWNFGSFTNYAKAQKKVPVSRVIESQKVDHKGDSFYSLIRARGVESGEIINYLTIDRSLLPLDVFPTLADFDFSSVSLYQTLREQFNVHPARAELSFSAMNAGVVEAKYFQIPQGTPLVRSRGTVYSQEDQPIEHVSVVYGPNVDFSISTQLG